MKLVETKLYTRLIILTDYILLGLLWIVCSLPLITIIPATAAIFSVMKRWQKGSSGSLLAYYFKGIKKYFLLNCLLNSFSLLFFYLIYQIALTSNALLIGFSLTCSMIYSMLLLAWCQECSSFPKQSFWQLFEKSTLSLLTQFGRIFVSVLLILFFSSIIYVLPPLLFLFAGGIWKLVYYFLVGRNREEQWK